jgi:hypothetical protein
MEKGFFTGNFEGKEIFCFYQWMCGRRHWKRTSASIRAPLGNLGVGGVYFPGT